MLCLKPMFNQDVYCTAHATCTNFFTEGY